MHEDDLLAALPSLFARQTSGVIVGSGPDDCAHVLADGRRLAFSIDAFAAGSHFPPDADPEAVARKALGASLSDLAASACRARWALVSLCLMQGSDASWAETFARGLAAAAEDFDVAIVGGDTISSPAATVVSVAAAGEPLPGGPLLRGGGRPGDALVVTGELGGSLGGRHMRPEPRLREIRLLLEFCQNNPALPPPSAAMDISDGLALDLSRLCRESGVGAILEAKRIPVAADARAMAKRSGRSPLRHALADGEDFELLIALPPPTWDAFQKYLDEPEGRRAAAGLARFTRIGALRSGDELLLMPEDGNPRPLEPEGYQHQW